MLGPWEAWGLGRAPQDQSSTRVLPFLKIEAHEAIGGGPLQW